MILRLLRDYFCKEKKTEDLTMDIGNCGMLEEISSALRYLANHSDSLLENVDNNVCEHFNSIINKHISGKRINYSQRGTFNLRTDAAVVSYNSNEYFRATHKALASGNSPGNCNLNH